MHAGAGDVAGRLIRPPRQMHAILQPVGADPEPLIREYDATVRSRQPVTAAELFQPVTPVKVRKPGRRHSAAALGLALVIVFDFAVYHFISGTRHAPSAHPAAAVGAGSASRHRAKHATRHPLQKPASAVQPYARQVVIRLTASRIAGSSSPPRVAGICPRPTSSAVARKLDLRVSR